MRDDSDSPEQGSMMWTQWVVDASMSDPNGFAFVPVEGDISGEHSIVFGMTLIADKPPGSLVGVVHPDGQDAVERFCEANAARLNELWGAQ